MYFIYLGVGSSQKREWHTSKCVRRENKSQFKFVSLCLFKHRLAYDYINTKLTKSCMKWSKSTNKYNHYLLCCPGHFRMKMNRYISHPFCWCITETRHAMYILCENVSIMNVSCVVMYILFPFHAEPVTWRARTVYLHKVQTFGSSKQS